MRLPAATITIDHNDVTVEQAAFEYAWSQLGDSVKPHSIDAD